jgi:glucose/arabinose dehydrogenase
LGAGTGATLTGRVRRVLVLLLVALSLLVLSGSAGAITAPAGFIDTTVVSGLAAPTSMVWDTTNDRLFVTEQGGDLRVVANGQLASEPFLHLNVDSNGERGLLGVELDPAFAMNHYVYVHYTVPGSPPHNRVSRFTAQGDVAAPGSEQILLDLDGLSGAANHNGGALHFGSDGKLYIASGDNANGANSQSLDNLLGKILRMNSDGTIPADNPFYGSATDRNQLIWAYGLRNPFTFGFQPGSGRLFVDDVGQTTYEEIDEGVAGANYGWPGAEGPAEPPNAAFTDPLFCYRHSTGDPECSSTDLVGCALTGGAFYDPPVVSFPAEYVGRYFFSDLCTGFIAQLDPANGNAVTEFATGGNAPVDLDTGPDGSLYYLEDGDRVGRISYQSTPTVSSFLPASGPGGRQVTIDGTYLAGATAVTLNGTPATFSVVLDTRLVATVPAGATTGPIEVTTAAGGAQGAGDFTVTAPLPVVAGFSPGAGPPGQAVSIKGSHFTGVTAVSFNSTGAQSFEVKSDKKILAVVATGTTTGPIAVTGPGGTTVSAAPFVIPPPPAVTGFAPASGPVGTRITITGSGFKGTKTVTINGTKASRSIGSDTTIVATVKKGTTSGPITVSGPNGTGVSVGTFAVT